MIEIGPNFMQAIEVVAVAVAFAVTTWAIARAGK